MDERKFVDNKHLNLKNDDFKIKEEVPSFDEIECLNILEVEITPSALSYGQIFIAETDEKPSFIWWITCNICQNKFKSLENFLDHATSIHLNKKTNLKTEHENVYNENLNNIQVENENVDNIKSIRGKESDEDYNIGEDDNADSDSNESITGSEAGNEDEATHVGNTRKKGLLPYNCEKCNKTFQKQSTLLRHLKVHIKNDNKIYECKTCHAKFCSEEKRLYRNHINRAHKERIPCLHCEKSFTSKFYLDAHIKTHTGAKDFLCSQCPAAFYSKASLQGHMRNTHLLRKVPCRYCSKPFAPGSGLEKHELVHTGEKPYVCEQCGTAFQAKRLLQNHINRHNNDRRFACDICGKKYFCYTYLREHKLTHADSKPYGCEICNARFNSRPALRTHKNLHSDVKKYHCKICGKSYAQSAGLYAHMKSHNIAEDKSLKV